MKRPTMKPGTVQCFYGKPERNESEDVCYQWGGDGATKRHANALAHLLGFEGRNASALKTAFAEYGFDISTLRISIAVLPPKEG